MLPTTTSRLVISKFLQRKAAISRGGVYKSDGVNLVYKNHLMLACWKGDKIILAARQEVDLAKQYSNIQLLISFAKIRRIKLYVARKGIIISAKVSAEYIKPYQRGEFSKYKNCGKRAKRGGGEVSDSKTSGT